MNGKSGKERMRSGVWDGEGSEECQYGAGKRARVCEDEDVDTRSKRVGRGLQNCRRGWSRGNGARVDEWDMYRGGSLEV